MYDIIELNDIHSMSDEYTDKYTNKYTNGYTDEYDDKYDDEYTDEYTDEYRAPPSTIVPKPLFLHYYIRTILRLMESAANSVLQCSSYAENRGSHNCSPCEQGKYQWRIQDLN